MEFGGDVVPDVLPNGDVVGVHGAVHVFSVSQGAQHQLEGVGQRRLVFDGRGQRGVKRGALLNVDHGFVALDVHVVKGVVFAILVLSVVKPERRPATETSLNPSNVLLEELCLTVLFVEVVLFRTLVPLAFQLLDLALVTRLEF